MKGRALLTKPAQVADGKQRTGPAQLPISLFHRRRLAGLAPCDWDIGGVTEHVRMEDGAGWTPEEKDVVPVDSAEDAAIILHE
jgi:hypothetical protein